MLNFHADTRDWPDRSRTLFGLPEIIGDGIKLKAITDYHDARDDHENPNRFIGLGPASYRDPDSDVNQKYTARPEVVDLGEKTINQIVKIKSKDPSDIAWLNEYKRRKGNGETDSDLRIFPPFGRKQNTILVDRSVALSKDLNTKLQILIKQLKGGASPSSVTRAVVESLAEKDAKEGLSDAESASLNTLVGGLHKSSGVSKDERDYGINYQYYSPAGWLDLMKKDQSGNLQFFIMLQTFDFDEKRQTPKNCILNLTTGNYITYSSFLAYIKKPENVNAVFDVQDLRLYPSETAWASDSNTGTIYKGEGSLPKPDTPLVGTDSFKTPESKQGDEKGMGGIISDLGSAIKDVASGLTGKTEDQQGSQLDFDESGEDDDVASEDERLRNQEVVDFIRDNPMEI